VTLQLPKDADSEDFEGMVLNNLKEELRALDVKIAKREGKRLELWFGMREIGRQDVKEENIKDYIMPGTLQIKLPSSYGECILDFEDGASCHLLNGGTTRMGKTCLLLYLCCILYLNTNGEITFYITSTKIKDFYPFQGLPGVTLCHDAAEFEGLLDDIIQEYKRRDRLINTPVLRKATDAKSVKRLYPPYYKEFKPVFLVIDEYARFSDNKEIQLKVMELVETAGYVNVHVIISSQRPDARTVLPPRIKGNLLARICFTTADQNNSLVILDTEGAEKLGRIQGRALFLNSDMNMVQVPFLDVVECDQIMEGYRKDGETDAKDESAEGPINSALADKVSSLFQESVSLHGVQEKYQPGERVQSSDEATRNGWFRLARSERKR
jgi:DNA segregation ATPase FtsK/SpoIIIE-like protein